MRRFEPVGSLPGIAIAVLLGMLLAGASAARPPFGGHHRGHGGGHGPGRFLDFYADELGLDEEKREAIRAIVEESRGEAEGLHAQLGALHEQLRELLSADPPDETAVMAQVEAIGAVEIQLHKHRLATLLRIPARYWPGQSS